MSQASLLPVFALMTSLLAAVIIFTLPERSFRLRTLVNLGAAVIKLVLVGVMIWGIVQGRAYEVAFTMVPGVRFVLRADALSMLFAGLSALLWLLTTIYAVGYLEGSPNRSRFFGFFSLSVASTMGIALAGNLFTFFLFYEMLTLSTYPLVVHRGTPRPCGPDAVTSSTPCAAGPCCCWRSPGYMGWRETCRFGPGAILPRWRTRCAGH